MAAKLRHRPQRRNPLSALRRERSGPVTAHPPARPASEAEAVVDPLPHAGPDEVRARAAGGPEDRALYLCECGSHFTAPVSASVRCPRCGAPQAW
ncbi:MAG: hypothetical protein M3Z33_05085 [Actinomycetota bacterium]|nr:hypothetical protein [Actinomycetota bacterium]